MKQENCIKFNNGYQIDLEIKSSFLQKLKGLLGLKFLPKNKGIVLVNCRQVHTFGMKFPIDLIVLDDKFNIVRFVGNLKPNKISPYFKEGRHVIELAANPENEKVFGNSYSSPVFAQLIHSHI
jgi:uncharacterized membrane protein (UPF0127 family)